MDPLTVLGKTVLGVEALNQRSADLPRVLRHALILVDGRSNLAELEAKGAIVPNFTGALAELITRGLIAERRESQAGKSPSATGTGGTATGEKPEDGPEHSPRDSLVALAERLLGARGGKVVKKLQEAGATRDELLAATDSCFKLIRLTIDEKLADKFRDAARLVLGSGD